MTLPDTMFRLNARADEPTPAPTDFVIRRAFGSWRATIPTGMVGVEAVRASDRLVRAFLIHAAHYEVNGGRGAIVDQTRALPWAVEPADAIEETLAPVDPRAAAVDDVPRRPPACTLR